MIKLLIFIVFTCAAIFLGPKMADSQGFVHVATSGTIVETSLTTAIILYISSIILAIFIYSLCKKILSMPKGTIRAFRSRSNKKKLSLQDEAIICFEQGEYQNALALLKHTSSLENMSERSLLIAAQSAFYIGLYDYTRQALDEAQSRSKQAKLAANVVRAKLNYNIGNVGVALEYLDQCGGAVKNKTIYKLYLDCYLKQNNYEKISEILKDLVKHEIINKETANTYYLRYLEDKLSKAKSSDDIDYLYKKLPKVYRKNTKILGAFVYKFISFGSVNRACEFSLELLKENVDPTFLESIANWEIAIPDVLVALKKYASKNIITTQVNLPLLKAMANLEYKSGLLQDALADYKQALSIESDAQVYLRMGVILSTLQRYPEATECYSRANSLLSENEVLLLTPDKKV